MSLRSRAFDVAVAAAVGTLAQLEAWTGFGATHRQGPLWAQSLLYAVTAALLVFRRRWPLLVLGGIVVASVIEFAMVGSPEGFAVMLASLVALYTVASRLPLRHALVGLLLAVLLTTAWAVLDPLNASATETLLSMIWMAPLVIAWLLGALVRFARINVEQRRINAAQRESQQVAQERSRIARELHDVLGHSVSVMTVQTSAVRRRLLPEQDAERVALETVEAVGRSTLAEMRRMLHVLRGEGEVELLPQPGLNELDHLADQFRAAGLPVVLEVSGDPAELAPGPALVAYRIVQEGLTNALRHARMATRAVVSVNVGPASIDIVIRDDGRPAEHPRTEAAPGMGLTGMRERVAVYGGSLRAGPTDHGGFELAASLPREAA